MCGHIKFFEISSILNVFDINPRNLNLTYSDSLRKKHYNTTCK